jgi:hypothetical protein
MIVTIQDFTSDPYAIPNLDAREDSFMDFADNHEREVLGKVLGPLLYDELTAGLLEDPIQAKWTALKNGSKQVINGSTYNWTGLKKALVPYIYAMWLMETVQVLSGNGMVRPSNENSKEVSPDRKIVRAYNDFVKLIIPKETYYTNRYLGGYGYGVVTYYNTLYDFVTAQPMLYANFNFAHFDLHYENIYGI